MECGNIVTIFSNVPTLRNPITGITAAARAPQSAKQLHRQEG
jgi:hypothetical protein